MTATDQIHHERRIAKAYLEALEAIQKRGRAVTIAQVHDIIADAFERVDEIDAIARTQTDEPIAA